MFARKGRYTAAYTHREPSRDEELRLLVRWTTQQAGTGLLFVGPEARSLENSAVAGALVKSRRARYTTWRNKDWWNQQRVIALWPSERALQQLDEVSTIDALGVLTWGLKEVAAWASGVGAIDLLAEAAPETPAIEDPVILGALRSLTNSVNLSTGLAHPSDWDHALQMFRTLRKLGHKLEGEKIVAWAVANGWSYRHASDVGKLAGEIAAGKVKRTKSGGASWVPSAATIDHWREIGAEAEWSPF